MATTRFGPAAWLFVIRHVFLPPQTPQGSDSEAPLNFDALFFELLLDALVAFGEHDPLDDQGAAIDSIVQMIHTARDLHATPKGGISEMKLRQALHVLGRDGGSLPLHVRAQNAGVFLTNADGRLVFETFELSPTNEAVMSTRGRLRRAFPGTAAAVPAATAADSDFQSAIAQILARMSHEPTPGLQPRARKAGQSHAEARDTSHPAMLCEFLHGFVAGIGEVVDVPVVFKNTRDDVQWHTALLPWRRSPLWLLLRVSLQLAFSRLCISNRAPVDLYKPFMVFFMSRILQRSINGAIPSDTLFIMNAKICQRLLKLQRELPPRVAADVRGAMDSANTALQARWAAVQLRESRILYPHVSELALLDFQAHTETQLPELDGRIAMMGMRSTSSKHTDFQPSLEAISYHVELPLPWPSRQHSSGESRIELQNLHGFENWIASDLSAWTKDHRADPDACGRLCYSLQSYHANAARHYPGNPEATSIMVLTAVEMWIACDLIATSLCPLLGQYQPGIPVEVLQNLLLPFRAQMDRLLLVEQYLHRRDRAAQPAAKIFAQAASPDCFAAKYFDQSAHHQSLRLAIEGEAQAARARKLVELDNLKAQYRVLMQKHADVECQYHQVTGPPGSDPWSGWEHSPTCVRCGYARQAEELQIEVHEWPLPAEDARAKTAVFELDPPGWYLHWRESTMVLLADVLRMVYQPLVKPETLNRFAEDPHLRRYHNGASDGGVTCRIQLLSALKHHLRTHRRKSAVGTARREDVCINSGLRYEYFDRTTGAFCARLYPRDDMLQACCYRQPEESRAMQKFLFRPAQAASGPPANEVIAGQADCPAHLTLFEFRELCSIPLGFNLQWIEIAAQLKSPSVDFRRLETALVFYQCLYQAGASDDEKTPARASHQLPTDETFAESLVEALNQALRRIGQNWESLQATAVLVAVARRLLSLSPSERIRASCRSYLEMAAGVTLDSMQQLNAQAQQSSDNSQREEFLARGVEAALVCASTFDVEREELSYILANDVSAASTLLQCCLVIHEGTLILSTANDRHSRLLLSRHQRLLRDAHQQLAQDPVALNDAIHRHWSAYEAGEDWYTVEHSTHWVITQTAAMQGHKRHTVHYNSLSGELLVDGQPLGRLPSEYEKHSCYQSLFGTTVIPVTTSSREGMSFSSSGKFHNCQLHFGLHWAGWGPKDLLVQAVDSESGTVYELIPRDLLQRHFADPFIIDYVHWYNATTETVEFRPITDPWNSETPHMWRLVRSGGLKWELSLSSKRNVVVSMTSKTSTTLAQILSPLAELRQIQVIFLPSPPRIEVSIPRLRLSFDVQQGEPVIASREFRGMVVDPRQKLGTLVGCQNLLVLRAKSSTLRKVLIVEGDTSCKRYPGDPAHPEDDHLRVTVDLASAKRWHCYTIDDCLGRLLDNGSTQSKLYLAYLHALTSSCVPDPCTETTGTEKALDILDSAALRSVTQFTPENVDLLHRIAQLTPYREFYPRELQSMQKISWHPELGFVAQHPLLCLRVHYLLAEAKQNQSLHPPSDFVITSPERGDWHLLERAYMRSSTWCIHGYGAELGPEATDDVAYAARDRNQVSPKRRHAYVFRTHVRPDRRTLPWSPPTAEDLWEFLCKTEKVWGSEHNMDLPGFQYEAALLADEHEFYLKVLAPCWPSMHSLLRRGAGINRYLLMTWLAALACSEGAHRSVLETIACFYSCPDFRSISVPVTGIFTLAHGREAPVDRIETAARAHFRYTRPLTGALFNSNREQAVRRFTRALVAKWPSSDPIASELQSDASLNEYINVSAAMDLVRRDFAACYNNRKLFHYLVEIQRATAKHAAAPNSVLRAIQWRERGAPPIAQRPTMSFIEVDELFAMPAPALPTLSPVAQTDHTHAAQQDISPVEDFVQRLQTEASSNFEAAYIAKLQASVASLRQMETSMSYDVPSYDDLLEYKEKCESETRQIYDCIMAAVYASDNPRVEYAAHSKHMPRLRPKLILAQLSRQSWKNLPADWKRCIVQYGVAMTRLQRAQRLSAAHRQGRGEDVQSELANTGHEGWNPMEHPDWLLFEVESNIMIRDVQQEIACQMGPEAEFNKSMQLNMGEGKSTVIVPMAVSALADGTRLVRVVAARPQAKQMAQMLVAKLGGLVDRQVYHLPVFRGLKMDQEVAQRIGQICLECKDNGGVLLLQPEHILSLELMCIEKPIIGEIAVGHELLKARDLIEKHSRDIVDESDENFSVKFELLYSMGRQRSVDLGPDRWSCIHRVLDLVVDEAAVLAGQLPQSLEVREMTPGRFPYLRILQPDAETLLLTAVGRRVCAGAVPGFPIMRHSQALRDAVFTYISKADLTEDEIKAVEDSGPEGVWSESARPMLFLLRGLLAGGVLGFVLGRKRWRVNYGLDPSREPFTCLAVPFRGKDSPSARAIYSHPDVVILLTSLCQYYGGLTDGQLVKSFAHLMDSDDKDTEYREWVMSAPALLPAFGQLNNVNLKDRTSCQEKVFPSLRHSKRVVDYFLSSFVFPTEVKEFPQKLTASGWDVGKKKRHATTAFSGTSDSQSLLPLDMTYVELPGQQHTNALVLHRLLQPDNSVALVPRDDQSAGRHLLTTVMSLDPLPRVILDVGAQILDMDNIKVARDWLSRHPESTRAVVFCNEHDNLVVLDRDDHVEPLQTSPFADSLDECLVFLDQAHTRGIDLRLPSSYRAAVTLGAQLTKDGLVQACMRMRKLGKGQTVVFCVNEEIRTRIQQCCGKGAEEEVGVADVLRWTMSESLDDIKRCMPLWAAQGTRFIGQQKHWETLFARGPMMLSTDEAQRFLENDAQDIESRHRPRAHSKTIQWTLAGANDERSMGILARLNEFRDLPSSNRGLEEEQEQELSPETEKEQEREQERLVERPPRARPAEHQIHPLLMRFIERGELVSDPTAFIPAFQALADTHAATWIAVSELARHVPLIATADFCRTVEKRSRLDLADAYQRPVRWILTSTGPDDGTVQSALIISPYEAQHLFQQIRQSVHVALHIYKPRLDFNHVSLEDLDFCTIPVQATPRTLPAPLKTWLNVFAGQLYFTSWDEYSKTCEVLGLISGEKPEGWIVSVDGFVVKDDAGQSGLTSGLSRSPVKFLKALFRIRRDGKNIGWTHMGKLLGGKLLTQGDM